MHYDNKKYTHKSQLEFRLFIIFGVPFFRLFGVLSLAPRDVQGVANELVLKTTETYSLLAPLLKVRVLFCWQSKKR